MSGKKPTKKSMLLSAVVWTVVAALWAVTAFLRTVWGGEEIDPLSVITMIATAVASIAYWYRYASHSE